MSQPVRHILGISGGKDSTALAVFMRQTYPDLKIEYFFCDTHKELPETYEYFEQQAPHRLLADVLTDILDEEDDTVPCFVCHV